MSGPAAIAVVDALPGLCPFAVVAELPRPLAELPMPGESPAPSPPAPDEDRRRRVRDVLRQRGYRPTGRGKPSSEYLAAAAQDGRWPWINAVVDAANLVSLHSGLPISVVDLDRLRGAPTVRVPAAGASYVFNLAGQEIELGGLPCLCDDDGPCANAVKDSQRTKTGPATRRLLAMVWGVDAPTAAVAEAAAGRLAAAFGALGASVRRPPVR